MTPPETSFEPQRPALPTIWLILILTLLGIQVALLVNLTHQIREFAESRDSPSGTVRAEAPGAVRIELVPTDGRPHIGPEGALVQIVVFSDYGCGACGMLDESLRMLASAHPDDVRITFRSFPPSKDAQRAARAVYCAAKQNRFLELHHALFLEVKDWRSDELLALAQSVGIDLASFDGCIDSDSVRILVEDDLAAGRRAGVQVTPTFFVNGRVVNGSIPYPEIDRIVREEIETNSAARS